MLLLRVGQRVGVELTVTLGLRVGVETGFWFKLGVVLEFTLVLGCELGITGGCKLGLLEGTGVAGLSLASDSFVVAKAAI